ncbi:MAG: polyamine aminopropyltransferase [Limnochordales bacterium]|nr:polyamine aminopropyltransferase [Limnochordales bacterium]
MELWFTEKQTPAVGITCKVRRTLVEEHTGYQHLAILETEQFGRMLVLDGMVQTTEEDEFVYHEMIVHVALNTHPHPRRVAVIGGGDGGTVREVLKHAAVEQVVLIEIDGRVVEACREHLPSISGGLADPRVEVRIADGVQHIRTAVAEYDVVIIDSTEPIGAAIGLFSPEFYRDVAKALRDDGIMVAQTESPFFNQDLIRQSYAGIRDAFPVARLYLASVPTYPSGLWSFTLGSKRYDPLAVDPASIPPLDTRYYTPQVHHAAFQLPRFVEELVRPAAAVEGGM